MIRKGDNPAAKGRILLIDVSNSFTKIAVARGGVIGKVRRIATTELSPRHLTGLRADIAVIASVVPRVSAMLASTLPCPPVWVDHRVPGGVGIDYPKPSSIGADRLANAAAAVALGKLPAIVVDFGTAVTFDVIDAAGNYLGGIIAPGLPTAAAALHERTALLPLATVTESGACVGRSTAEAIRSGLLLGAVGLVREAVSGITAEAFGGKRPHVIATGGDAALVAQLSLKSGGRKVIDMVDPMLTLKGLMGIGVRNLP